LIFTFFNFKVQSENIGKGNGFASYVYGVTLHFDSADSYSFALKVPTLDSWEQISTKLTAKEKQHNAIMIRQMQNAECSAYEIISKIPGFPAPKMWHAMRADEKQLGKYNLTNNYSNLFLGMLIMDDLSREGRAVGIFYSVTKEQCFNLVKNLVDFQVRSSL
jgi:hypothetical protein